MQAPPNNSIEESNVTRIELEDEQPPVVEVAPQDNVSYSDKSSYYEPNIQIIEPDEEEIRSIYKDPAMLKTVKDERIDLDDASIHEIAPEDQVAALDLEDSLNPSDDYNSSRKQSTVAFAPFTADVMFVNTLKVVPPSVMALDMDDEAKAQHFYDSTSPRPLVEGVLLHGRWTDNSHACSFFASLMSLMYAFVITLFALVIEISPVWGGSLWVGEMVFYIWMYGVGLLFFAYCYLFMLYPGWFGYLQKILYKMGILKYEQKWVIEKTSHTGESCGSLYLRLGALFFGSFGIVLFCIEIFLCFRDNFQYKAGRVVELVFQILFVFIQMHFIFCNSKMVILTSKTLCKFGIMHNVATNIFTWTRFVIIKAAGKANKKKKKVDHDISSNSSEEIYSDVTDHDFLTEVVSSSIASIVESTTAAVTDAPTSGSLRVLADFYLGDITTFLVTCIVEYSVIGGAVMFILWMSIDSHEHNHPGRVKRKSRMRVDCSASSLGFFFGIFFLIMAFFSIGVFSVLDKLKDNYQAVLVFTVFDMTMFICCILACLVGLWRMRKLAYKKSHSHHSAEVLDEILLFIGLFGEIAYCCIVIDIWISTRHAKDHSLPTVELFVFIFRLIEVVVQAIFILICGRLRATGPELAKKKPGKQFVTFLLVVNITLFFFHTFEGMKSTIPLTGSSQAFPYVVYGIAPLTVFYRFHSSACLAEIWKHTYNTKLGDSNSATTFGTTMSTGSSEMTSLH